MSIPVIPLFTVKVDCTSYHQLRLMDAWNAWGVPCWQQRLWISELWDSPGIIDLTDLISD